MKKFFFVFALAACGGSGGGGGDIGAVQQERVEVICSRAFECMSSFPTDIGLTFEDLFGTSEAECVSGNSADPAEIQEIKDSIAAGRLIFDAGDAAACTADLETATCDAFWNEPGAPECETELVGTVADGGTCTNDIECVGEDSFCDEETNVCGPL